MKDNKFPTVETIKKYLRYEADTGFLYWKERVVSDFPAKWALKSCNTWNARHAGKRAFTALNAYGYHHGTINGHMVRAHAVVWAMFNGGQPKHMDHINGIRSDNRIENLRESSHRENGKNTGISKRNTSGAVGVCFDKRSGKWCATLGRQSKGKITCIHLGRFATFEEAVAARRKANIEHGFHPNHGMRSSYSQQTTH